MDPVLFSLRDSWRSAAMESRNRPCGFWDLGIVLVLGDSRTVEISSFQEHSFGSRKTHLSSIDRRYSVDSISLHLHLPQEWYLPRLRRRVEISVDLLWHWLFHVAYAIDPSMESGHPNVYGWHLHIIQSSGKKDSYGRPTRRSESN